MTIHVIWAFVATVWVLALWDMVRRWAFASATRTLKAEIDSLHARIDHQRRDLDALSGSIAERGLEKLPARVKQLETVVLALKQHVEVQVARPNPFGVRKAGA